MITLSDHELSITEGETFPLTATTNPPDVEVIIWESSDENTAIVEGGLVSALANGVTTITASFELDGETYSDTCTVTVTAEEPTPSITLDQHELTVDLVDSYLLTATTVPAGETVTWTSSNNAIAAVDQDGYVSGNSAGTATITASITVDGVDYTDTCTVTVEVEPGIWLDSYSASLFPGETFQNTAYCIPASEASNISWSNQDDAVATISGSGDTVTVTAVSEGTTSVTASLTYDGHTYDDSFTVNVLETPSEPFVMFGDEEYSILEGTNYAPSIITYPRNEEVTLTSASPSIVSITTFGGKPAFHGEAEGSATVTATITVEGTDYTDTVTVTVDADDDEP